ncbi:MAG: carbohydrate ABC transporter permease [Clostridiales bacterium]|nr:carbohydrate ABC transporter permease [Clostridiales bacterium]
MMTGKKKRQLRGGASYALKVLIGLLFISPMIIGLLFSFQSDSQLGAAPLRLITENPTIENYIEVFRKVPLLHYLKNTAVVCVVAICAQIVFSSLAAYAFVYFDFPLKKQLWTLILMTMMVPGEVVVITNYVTAQNLHLINTYAGLFITSMISGTAIFMMRQYYMQLPKDFKEAAVLDGCGDIGFLFRVATPLSIPTISALAVYLFVHIYNAYFWPLLVTNKDTMRTIQIGISFLVTGDIISYGQILAGAMVAILPSVIAYIFGQDYIIKGMTAGGIKG